MDKPLAEPFTLLLDTSRSSDHRVVNDPWAVDVQGLRGFDLLDRCAGAQGQQTNKKEGVTSFHVDKVVIDQF